MSIEHTIVVRFDDDAQPQYGASTEFQGGQVVAVAFDGNRLRVEEELVEALENLLDMCDVEMFEADQIAEVVEARKALERATSAEGIRA